MRMYDLISRKKRGLTLSKSEIDWFICGVMSGEIPDYQISAFLMTVCFKSLDERETFFLTDAMLRSGETHDLSSIGKITGDKHSTGGVGDKTTLVTAPVVAACGGFLPKMSGRGLGHTGGTIDKLESIPGFKTDINFEEFKKIVKENGFAVVCQTGELAPADKKLYAIRDATAAVDSVPLIASSIMSKKLATGTDAIMLDIKAGSGAFMKNVDAAVKLAEVMMNIAEKSGKKCSAVISDMNRPLGYTVGNALEVIEAFEILKGKCKNDTYTLSVELAANILYMQEKGTIDECRQRAADSIENGSAFERMKNAVRLQGGDPQATDDYSLFFKPKYTVDILAERSGYIKVSDCEEIGLCASMLGAGRKFKDDIIDPSAGICIYKNHGDKVKKGEKIASLYTSSECDTESVKKRFLKSYSVKDKQISADPIIIEYFSL